MNTPEESQRNWERGINVAQNAFVHVACAAISYGFYKGGMSSIEQGQNGWGAAYLMASGAIIGSVLTTDLLSYASRLHENKPEQPTPKGEF